ncbi:podocalyxin [Heliangelus exortis]|uniref:podocalyxin n=1 Tax=Heliangelus exortis TaxID=472823 RepID=UPI003A91D447
MKITTTTDASKVQVANPTSPVGKAPSTLATSLPTSEMTTKLGNPSSSSLQPSTAQGTTPTTDPTGTSSAVVQGTTSMNNPGNPQPTTPSPHQQLSSSPSSGPSTFISATTSREAQQKVTISPSAITGSTAAATAANPIPTRVSSPQATSRGFGTTVSSSPSVGAQGNQPSNQPTSTTGSTGVSVSSLSPALKDYGASSPTSAAKQPHSSPSSPVQGLVSSITPGSIGTAVTPFGKPISPTTSQSGISSVSVAATTSTLGAGQDTGSVPTKSPSGDQKSPASAQPSAPGDQTASSHPGYQHLNTCFQNEVICKDQVQNNSPTLYLKEAKTCDEWRAASINISFFESFCSTGQHTFNASRETCTVILTSLEPLSQHWAVQAVIHIPLDPEKVLEELKEKKEKLDELGIANITYDKMEKEMVITDEFSTPLIITIVTLAGSLLLVAAIYGCCHQRFSQKKDQHIHPDLPGFDDGHVALIFNQRLTEELQTMENGYHDNPTLEVMETSSEMQEKKVNLNGELGDSWIVPLDTLMKEDLEEEEDTHL